MLHEDGSSLRKSALLRELLLYPKREAGPNRSGTRLKRVEKLPHLTAHLHKSAR